MHLIDKVLLLLQFVEVWHLLMQNAEDLVVDIPKFWEITGELIG